jgi:hypothetical protein
VSYEVLFEGIPANSKVISDCSDSKFIDYDLLELMKAIGSMLKIRTLQLKK